MVMRMFIHLAGADGKVIDSVPDDYEDAFTLEAFGDMCKAYQKSDKNVAMII
jgi:mannose/cellobiose epimerase-like protein (N-acyl-D-glucosamine 2-epimerase family)